MKIARGLSLLLLVAMGRAAASQASESSFEVSGDVSVNLGDDKVEVRGNVEVLFEGYRLRADHLLHEPGRRRMEASGRVRLSDERFSIEAGHFLYDLASREGLASREPRLLESAPGADGSREETALTAVQVRLDSARRRIEALERVELVRSSLPASGHRQVEFRILCRQARMDLLTGRTDLSGQVDIRSPTLGASGRRVEYDRGSRRFIIVGEARAWTYDESGREIHEVRGNKIVHFLAQGRSLIMGAVDGVLHPGARPGRVELQERGER